MRRSVPAWITAVRRYLLLVPKRASHGGGKGSEELELDLAVLAEQLEHARQWLAAPTAASSGAVLHADFTGFRE